MDPARPRTRRCTHRHELVIAKSPLAGRSLPAAHGRESTRSAATHTPSPVDWSYGLLEEDARVLRCQSALRRRFILEGPRRSARRSASRPTTSRRLEPTSVSTFTRRGGRSNGRRYRYRLLETIRQYALEKLEEGGGAAEFRARHRRWLGDLAATTRDVDFIGATIHDALEARDPEHRRDPLPPSPTTERSKTRCGSAATSATSGSCSHLSEGESWIVAMLDHPDATDPVMRGNLLVWRGLPRSSGCDWTRRSPRSKEALELGETHGDNLLKALGDHLARSDDQR